jgi:amino-acid N-acetyltransferase
MSTSDERVRPERVRLSGLQEAQLATIVEIEQACTAMYYDAGFDPARVGVRSLPDIVTLTRHHNVGVAEADHMVAGYVARQDEAPGVAFIEELAVHPSLQRFGIGSRLLDRVRDEARAASLGEIVLHVWEKASWAMAFCRRHGFAPIDDHAPARVLAWRDDAQARPPASPGGIILWAVVGEAPRDDGGAAEQ